MKQATQKSKSRDPITRLPKKPVVAIQQMTSDETVWRQMVARAEEYGWQLLNLGLSGGWIPTAPPPIGAITRQVYPHEDLDMFLDIGCPMVRQGSFPNPNDDIIPAVVLDFFAAGVLAADHFFERDFRHLGYVANSPFQGRKAVYDGFTRRAGELGMTCSLIGLPYVQMTGPEKFIVRNQMIKDWLDTLPRPIGIMAYCDRMAARICYSCLEKGLSVPEEAAILGIGNQKFECEAAPVSLSSIDIAHAARILKAMDLLRDRIQGSDVPRITALQPEGVVVRRSTDMIAVGDRTVAKAIRFIWDYLDQDLSVDDIANDVGLSRRTLERAFKKHVGRGPNAELRRRRIVRCCDLLQSTDLSMDVIAGLIGMVNKANLYRAFKREMGMTPGEFRETSAPNRCP